MSIQEWALTLSAAALLVAAGFWFGKVQGHLDSIEHVRTLYLTQMEDRQAAAVDAVNAARESVTHIESGPLQWSSGDWGEATLKRDGRKCLDEQRIFQRQFAETPSVVLTLVRLDVPGDMRIDAEVTDANEKGFTALVCTWGNTTVTGAGLQWIAFPKAQQKTRQD